MTLREYLDKWYKLDRDYENKWEITIWYVETGAHYAIYKNKTYVEMYDKYVRNDRLKRITHITQHRYVGNDKALYVFVTDDPVDNPDISTFETFREEMRERKWWKRVMKHD